MKNPVVLVYRLMHAYTREIFHVDYIVRCTIYLKLYFYLYSSILLPRTPITIIRIRENRFIYLYI